MSELNYSTEVNSQPLLRLLEEGTSPFHVVQWAARELQQAGFQKLEATGAWELRAGGSYLVEHHGSTLFAFHVGEGWRAGMPFMLAAAHTDYPCLRIKPKPEVLSSGYAQLNMEVYGGPILNTWMDRPLAISGRVALKSEEPRKPKLRLFSSGSPVLTIPNLAIHMNRDVNKGVELNRQTELLPIAAMLFGESETATFFQEYLAKELGVAASEILDYELSVVSAEKPCPVGLSDDFLSSPRLDNLTSVEALVTGIKACGYEEGICAIALFDHEEIGSRTKQGAGSLALRDMLEKAMLSMGAQPAQCKDSLYDSMLLSVDVAHALHPNYAGRMDITNKPVLNGGVCIKEACAQTYATDSEAIAIIQQLCEANHIPYQKFVNRSDMPGGGTLGSIASSLLPIRTVDIGVPLLAMHSARECMGRKDQRALEDLVKAYFT